MLYKLTSNDGGVGIEPVQFKDFSHFGKLEKDLEDLIAKNILDLLFEEASLMPIFQERAYQAEADIYALNEFGELVIFELKRSSAGSDAVHQLLRYAQDAGKWSFAQIEERYKAYSQQQAVGLLKAHQEAFQLEHPLDVRQVNLRQKLIVIGSAADESLIDSVDYWKRQGLCIDFLPYRIYEIGSEKYFEFFALPYDKHPNPTHTKGVIFDTNRSWDEDSIWYMVENSRVAAFGDAKRFIEYVYPGDIVFFSHRYVGVVAAAKVKKGAVKSVDDEELYRDVEFITPVPKRGEPIKAMSFGRVSEFTGKSFFWARTIKVPYLTKEEAEALAAELKQHLRDGA